MNYIHNIFFPTPYNHHKAYLLRSIVLIPLMSFILVANLSWIYFTRTHANIKGLQTDLTPSQIIELTNLERTKAGVGALQPNELLNTAAQKKAESMIQTGVFEHYYEDDSGLINPWQFILESGYEYFHAGENLGKGFSDSRSLVQAWMDSPTHKDNLLNPDYTEIGVAVIQGPYLEKTDTVLVVQLFATPVSAILENQELASANPQEINLTPLLEQDQSWAQALIKEYPILLFGMTFSVVVILGLTLIVDLEAAKKKADEKTISIDLWRH